MGVGQDSRESIEQKVIEVGRRQLADHGAAGLSLGAVCEQLDLVPADLHRCVASRDELLTLLLVDAYTELADTVDRARNETAADMWRDDVFAIARAVRGWAVTHPSRWALLYGSPVPGYHAPPDRTTGVGTRVVRAFFDAIGAGITMGDILLTTDLAPQPMSSDFERIRDQFGFPGDDRLLAKCFLLWAGVVGAISLEVFGQYGPDTLTDPEAVFDTQMRMLVEVLTRR
ncbi:TetR-like C-terminal domain-containing protein [Mycobacterium sp. 1423905.2]|uniref:TetR-like C-terminal domain-containing protein n=1 Tax=Mycobacterium sp. 1423905.2 TaxID=1856859 RepID=UPI0007FF8ED9|nr:TetR-like C-terminal domain-containing protein [Mycobacterium sp. 1423905.2]OBJ61652.1 TetR family transcriptional regulator [Mycobacterium sp. 1423905.2]